MTSEVFYMTEEHRSIKLKEIKKHINKEALHEWEQLDGCTLTYNIHKSTTMGNLKKDINLRNFQQDVHIIGKSLH